MTFFLDDADLDRANSYALFSPLFLREPDGTTLIRIKEIFEIKFGDSSDEIRKDFSYLFSEAGGRLPPYESLYNYPLSDKPRLWGPVTGEVQTLYEDAGITLAEEIELVPDHLSAELLFMSYLIENRLPEQEKFFLEHHLLAWVPDYCDEIKRIAWTSFYKRVAELLTELIIDECEEFGIDTDQ
jgi:anaerobic sulfite reductase subunit A